MGVRAQVTMRNNINSTAADIMRRLVVGQTAAAEQLLDLALEEVPRDTGLLASSGKAIPATTPEQGSAVTFDTPYAAIVHEKQVKYLENPAVNAKGQLGDTIRKQVRGG